MKNIIWPILVLCILAAMPTGTSQEGSSQPIVNLMIDLSKPLPPTEEQATVERDNLTNIYNSMIIDRVPSTMFLTKDVSSSQFSLFVTQLGLYGNIEFGMSSNNSNDELSSRSYSEQLKLLQSSKMYADACHVCGKNEMPILGFRPQSYDQNEDTYKALDEIGIEYNAGFQAGLLYAPGHENDVWPYLFEGHNFYAVPLSTTTLSGEKVVLQDSYFKDKGLSGAQWYSALAGKLDEIQGKDEPLVIGLTESVSGSGDYLDALKKFIAYAQSKNASFVKTAQLVEMARSGVHDLSALPAINASECKTCNKEESTINTQNLITVSTNATNTSPDNKSQ
jgi:hypothetical protein